MVYLGRGVRFGVAHDKYVYKMTHSGEVGDEPEIIAPIQSNSIHTMKTLR